MDAAHWIATAIAAVMPMVANDIGEIIEPNATASVFTAPAAPTWPNAALIWVPCCNAMVRGLKPP
ncbi:hypothetical protein MHBO_005157 [Bonamia ostreae]|uniref:Uncharacterized protein n=1 Tax=Bonamia ostreae TaxID=126728 RepID=A0ABV2AV73_9EUKA